MNREDGIMTVHCMSTKDYLKFYNEDKYWNLDTKEDFVSETRSLWLNNTNKYSGKIFNTGDSSNEKITLTQLKVDKELEEAIQKHGEVSPAKKYEDQFYEKINQKK